MKFRLALMIPVLALLPGCGSDDSVTTTTTDNTAYITDSPTPAPAAESRAAAAPLVTAASRSVGAGSSYKGRVLYRNTRTPVSGVTVEIVAAKDDGKPTDEVLGTTRADAEGHFTVSLTEPTEGKVALVVAAVRVSADSGGDRSQQGYEVKTQQTTLGVLPFPDSTKPNTLLIDRRQPGRSPNDS